MLDILFVPMPPQIMRHPPVAPAVLAAIVKRRGYTADIYDLSLKAFQEHSNKMKLWIYNFNDYEIDVTKYAKEILAYDSKWIGLSVFCRFGSHITRRLCSTLKTLDPTRKILVGGNSEIGKELYAENLIDSFVHGPGEDAILNVLDGTGHPNINSNNLPLSVSVATVQNAPTFAYDLYDLDAYYRINPNRRLSAMISKGCAYSCTFCKINALHPKFRTASGENAANSIATYVNDFNAKEIYFSDSLINGNMPELNSFFDILKAKQLDVEFTAYWKVRKQHLNPPEIFCTMQELGFKQMSIGIESGSDTIRRAVKKYEDQEDIFFTIEHFIKNNIQLHLSFIIGHPAETQIEFEETIQFLQELHDRFEYNNIKEMVVGTMAFYQGTELMDEIGKYHVDYSSGFNWENEHSTLELRQSRMKDLVTILKNYGFSISYENDNRVGLINDRC